MTIDRLPMNTAEMVQGHIRHKRWYRLVSALACVVVFCVTYALMMPAITLTGDPHCGLEEHTHTDECYTRPLVCEVEENHEHTGACYEAQDVCVCGLEETDGHGHTDECYSEQSCYICGLEESTGHAHDASCWQSVETLSCALEETDGHTHGPDCYTQVSTLICTEDHEHTDECYTTTEEISCPLAETTAHHHDASCYTTTEECICPLEESTGHTHTDDCLGTETVLSCGLEECDPHTHTDECYESQLVLVCETEEYHVHTDACYGEAELTCGLEVHSHTESCYSDPEASVETAADWERTLADVSLSGEWPADVLAVAKSQLGYTESTTNYIIDESGARKGYTRYGAWYGVPYGDWCAMYVSFCLHYAGVPAEAVPRHSGCRSWVELLRAKDLYYTYDSDYEPQSGDIIFFDTDGCGLADHVGLIVSVEGEYMTTIEGNNGNRVDYHTYALSDSRLYGVGSVTEAWQRQSEPEAQPDWRCGLVEHIHDDGCYTAGGYLLCEIYEHSHDVALCLGPHCGMEEHIHEDGCYDESGELICPLPDHTHADECYGPQCALAEHIHGESCFGADGDVLCALAEHIHTESCLGPQCGAEEHTHADECYDESGELVCDLDEHTHTPDCLGLQCGLDEHTHAAECYDEYGELVCELDEHTHDEGCLVAPVWLDAAIPVVTFYCGLEEHTHGDTCYDESGALICALEEHAHTPDCLTEPQPEPIEDLEAALEALEALETLSEDDRLAAEALMERLRECYQLGGLTDEEYAELCARVLALLRDGSETVAEAAEGTNWIVLRDSGWFEEYADAGVAALSADEPMLLSAAEGDTSPSGVQIDSHGGSNTQDGVTVSKTIAGTELENVFDITLTVETPQKIDEVTTEPDMAVVIVMDISNTMNDNFGGVTRYAAAMEAAEDFLDNFAENNSLGVSKIGYVAFNTDAHKIFDLSPCTNETDVNKLKNTMRTQTGNIINADGYSVAHSRFTNVEGGLKMAQDMLDGVSNKNKFIILLTDGFPTTYLESGYKGYDPYDTTGRFYDHVLNVPCASGTSYSDEAAIRARNMAASIRNSGTTIFSIGVDVGGQTIQAYIESSEKLAAGTSKISIVDRTGTTYEIGSATSTEAYKNWLKNSIGSGEKYYYDSTDTEGLKNAYNQIFAEIKKTIQTSTKADWVATDPIPVQNGNIEFIGLYDKYNNLTSESLVGEHKEGAENTAKYQTDGNSISWDLKNSGYTTTTQGETTWYHYKLKYRVRLTNEAGTFSEYDGSTGTVYSTNGETKLQYRLVKTANGATTMSETKKIEFPIPSVYGYLSQLEFRKQDGYGRAVSGAEFTLSHSSTCNICRGDRTCVPIKDMTATSDADGQVSFTGIPSGHTYTLEETKVPPGYSSDGKHYTVTVSYDKVTVMAKDHTWQPIEDFVWNGVIVNNTSYALPQTGGVGTVWFTAAGTALLLGGAWLLRRRKRADEM